MNLGRPRHVSLIPYPNQIASKVYIRLKQPLMGEDAEMVFQQPQAKHKSQDDLVPGKGLH
jgi:hypothetical protein